MSARPTQHSPGECVLCDVAFEHDAWLGIRGVGSVTTLVARKVGMSRRLDPVKGKWEPVPVYAFHHPCNVDGCRERAPFGFGVNLKLKQGGLWFCSKHKGQGDECDARGGTEPIKGEPAQRGLGL